MTNRGRVRDDRGMAVVIVALALVVLLTAVAFVVDLGDARQERRHAQNGVDAAALAAARIYDGTEATEQAAMTEALFYLQANDFSVPSGATSGVLSYPCTAGGCEVDFEFTSGSLRPCVTVELNGFDVDTSFAQVIGRDVIEVGARGSGCRRGLGGATSAADTPAMFSKSATCDSGKTLELNGSNVTVNGTITSNGDIKIPGSSSQFNITGVLHTHTKLEVSGSNNAFNGAVTYGNSFSNGGSNNTFDVGYPKQVASTPVADWPIEIDIAHYVPGGARANAAAAEGRYHSTTSKLTADLLGSTAMGSSLSGNVLQPGLYYTSNELDLDLNDVTIAGGGGVTFVSEGLATLKWSTPGHVAKPYEPNGLFLFGNYRKASPDSHKDNCDSSAVSLPDGNDFDWEGIVYAPRGQAKVNGSDGTAITGSIMALALQVSGQHFTINADPDLFPGGADEVYLDE